MRNTGPQNVVTPSQSRDVAGRDGHQKPARWFASLIGLVALTVLLQGVWAGLFLQSDQRPPQWIEVHARGGELAIILSAVATVVAFLRLRGRRDLWLGSALLTLLLVVEAYLGGLITDDQLDRLTPVHIPLALAITGLTVWLALRAMGRTDGYGNSSGDRASDSPDSSPRVPPI